MRRALGCTGRFWLALAAATLAAGGGRAEPGQGLHAGPWTLRPYLELQAVYDSNIGQAEIDEVDDTFLDATLGLRAGYSAFDLDVSALGFLARRSYLDTSDADFSTGGEVLKVQYGERERVVFRINQSFRRVQDLDRYESEAAVGGVSPDSVLDVSSRIERDVNQVGVSVGKDLTDKLGLDVGYRFDAVDYDAALLSDLASHFLQLELAHKLTDKTDMLVTGKAGRQDADSVDGYAAYYAGRAGFKTRASAKVDLKASVGAQQYEPPEGDSETALNFDVSAAWLATAKVLVQAGGRNGTQLSTLYAANSVDYTTFWLGSTYRALPTLALSLNGAYREDDYLDQVPVGTGLADRKDKGYAVRARADYTMPVKVLRLFAEATYETVDSNLADYDEMRAGLGAMVQY